MTWQLASVVVLTAALAVGFGWYERSRPPARVLALVAALAALAAIGRVAFAAFPNVKPTSDIVLFAGYSLGAPAGFAVGAVAALVSNIFLGQGPWTPWQMAAWGVVGLLGALLGRALRGREPNRFVLAAVCGLAGLLFGALMDVYQWTLAAEHTLATYVAVSGTSLGFNLAHAVGNVVFALLIGPAFIRALNRYRRRFDVRWLHGAPRASAGLATLLLALVLAAPATADPPADVAPAIGRAVHFLRFSQNSDGGFGAARRQSSTELHTGWAALGLASAGRNPLDVKRRGKSIMDYIAAHSGTLSDVGELERTMLVLRSAGAPQRLAGRNLLRALVARQRRSGAFDTLNHTAFGVLALRAAGKSTRSKEVRAAVRWLLRVQNEDGGFGFARGAASDVDDTAAVMQALAAGGRRTSPVVRRALGYLRRAQRPDGGFGQMRTSDSNAQSTAFAIQGLVAIGRNPRKFKRTRTPIEYLKSLQAPDGSIRYSRTSAQTPIWVTAQALVALEGKPYPLRPAPRRRARTAAKAVAQPKAAATSERAEADRDDEAKPAARAASEPAARAASELESADADGDAGATTPPVVDVRPAAETTATTATTAPATGDDGEGGIWPLLFAGLLGIAILAAIRFGWRRG